jgi:protoporphyrinogen oxidase
VAEVVILGAGLTGLSAAYNLDKKGFSDYKIFEKENKPGGLLRSFVQDGFTFDFTGHLLHVNNLDFHNFLNDLCDLKNFDLIRRNAGVYSHNITVNYPFQMNLAGLPSRTIYECINGFINRKTSIKSPKMFKDWVSKYYGAGFGKHFFFPYNSKLFALDARKTTQSWTGRFVPRVNLSDLLQGAIEQNKEQKIGYNQNFYYPQNGGIEFLIKNLVKKISKPIFANHKATQIDLQNRVVRFENGHQEPFKKIISTLPLNQLLMILKEKSNSSLSNNAASKLKCTSVINFNLGFDSNSIGSRQWLYFSEKQYAFYRIGFWNNINKKSVPDGCSAIYGETAYLQGTKTYKQVDLLTEKSIEQTLNFLNLSKSNFVTKNILPIQHAYVIYDLWREKNIKAVHKKLNDTGIYSVGRYGGWRYSSMQEDALDGKLVIENVV